MDGTLHLRNSIVYNNGKLLSDQLTATTLDASFNCIQGWTAGGDNFGGDPLFAMAGVWNDNGTPTRGWDDYFVSGDYHLRSAAGRWNGMAWVADEETSPAIDAGEPGDWGLEPWPNGQRLNLGVYGGTAEASLSLSGAGAAGDFNRDRRVDLADFAMFAAGWLQEGWLVAQDLNRDGRVDAADLVELGGGWMREF